MKADYYGTPTEAKRYIQGWLTPTERRASLEIGRCFDCAFFQPASDDQGEFCRRFVFATRANAACRAFMDKETAA